MRRNSTATLVAQPPHFLPLVDQLEALLGVASSPIILTVKVYLPNRDRFGNLISNHARWVDEGRFVLSDLAGGCTVVEGRGTYRRASEGTAILSADFEGAVDVEKLNMLVDFLRRFCSETNQAEVRMVVVEEGHFRGFSITEEGVGRTSVKTPGVTLGQYLSRIWRSLEALRG